MSMLMSRVIGSRSAPRVELESSEADLVRYCRRRWPTLHEVPIHEWFIPDLTSPVKYRISPIFKEV